MLQSNIDDLQSGGCRLGENANVGDPISFTSAGSLDNLDCLGRTFSGFANDCEDLARPRCSGDVDAAVETLLTVDQAAMEGSCTQSAGFSFASSIIPPTNDIKLKLCLNLDCQKIVEKIRTAGVPECYTLRGEGVLDQVMGSYDADCTVLLQAYVASSPGPIVGPDDSPDIPLPEIP